jgi:hypothetical protein
VRVNQAKTQYEGFLVGLLLDADDGSDMFLRNVGLLSLDYTLYPRRENSFKVASISHKVPTASEACSIPYPVSSRESLPRCKVAGA